jgi:hypothetical protein
MLRSVHGAHAARAPLRFGLAPTLLSTARCSGSASSAAAAPIRKDSTFRRVNLADGRLRLAVLVDAEALTVRTYFESIAPHLRTLDGNTLLTRVFAHDLSPEWQQVVLNRGDAFEAFAVARFIAVHMQMCADAAYIAQLRLSNKAQGVALCCRPESAPLIEQQLERRDSVFMFVHQFVVTPSGVALQRPVGGCAVPARAASGAVAAKS